MGALLSLAVIGVALSLLYKDAVVVSEASLQPNHDLHPLAEFHDVRPHVDSEDEGDQEQHDVAYLVIRIDHPDDHD